MINENEIRYDELSIDKENAIVSYNDKLHKYWLKDTYVPCISVTTLIHKFQTFDEAFWSAYKALELLLDKDEFKSIKTELLSSKVFKDEYLIRFNISKDDYDKVRNEILEDWNRKREESCIRGNGIHRENELGHLDGNTPEIKRLGLGGTFVPNTTNMLKLGEQNIYPEILLSYVSEDGKFRLAGQADLVIVDGSTVYVIDYKGLPLDTPLATPNGWIFMKDIKEGDIVFDKEGKPTNVKHVSKIHKNPCYKINFDNSESIVCDHEHKWEISFRRGKDNYISKVMTVKEIEYFMNTHDRTTYNIPRIMNSLPLDLPDIDLPIDPYIFGAWLGDGSKSCGIITNVNPKFWEEVKNRNYSYGENLSGETKAEMHTIYNIHGKLNELNVLNNKFIPDIYLRSSYKQRLDLLRGIMDTDGYYHTKRKRFVMNTDQEWQAKDLVKLITSLGWKPTVFEVINKCNGKEFNGWNVCFFATENPFLIRNQDIPLEQIKDNSSFRIIESIESIKSVETKCIEVDSLSHTYLAGYSLIPTHNTNKKIEKKSYFDSKTRRSQMMKYPLNNLEDTNFWHYTIQLSTYAWMIEKANPGVLINKLVLIHYDHEGQCTPYECDYLKADVERMLSFYKKEIEHEEFVKSRTKISF